MLVLFKRYLWRPYRLFCVVGPLFKVIEVVFDLATPLVVAWMIDAGVAASDASVVIKGGLALLVMALVGYACALVTQKMASDACQGFATGLRRDLFAQVMALTPLDLARQGLGTSSLMTRMGTDVTQLQLAVSMLIRQVIRWPVLAIGSVVCALAVDPALGAILCVATPLVVAVFYVVMRASMRAYTRLQERLDAIGRAVQETVTGMRPIRAFCRERSQYQRFSERVASYQETAATTARYSSLLSPASFVIMNAAILAILYLGAGAVEAGRLETGQIMALIGYMNQLLVSLVFVASLVVIFTRAFASGTRVEAVLALTPSRASAALTAAPCGGAGEAAAPSQKNGKGAAPLAEKCGEGAAAPAEKCGEGAAAPAAAAAVPVLSLENLGFAYSATAAPALIGVEVKLYAGESLGVIGPTACGKTTLARLITRGCDPTEGCVRVNGCDLAALSEHARVAAIAYVPQHTQLLRGTVRSNLVWRDAGASDEDLWEALANAQIEDAVAHLPQGLEAPVTAGGGNFSGGQRQRLTIARALVATPQILVLDDATSALDYLTERALIAALDAQAAATGQVRVVMSQRIASVAACTRVLVLDAGHVVDLGTHAELKARCALYQELCALQEAPAREEVCDG